MSNRNEHESRENGAESSRGIRGLGASVAVLLVAIALLIALALATRSDTPNVRESNGTGPAARRGIGGQGAMPSRSGLTGERPML